MKHTFRKAFLSLITVVILGLAITTGANMAQDAGFTSLPADPFGIYFWVNGDHSLPGSEEMAAAGARWTNVQVHWQDVEMQPGQYDWSKWDAVLLEASAHNRQVITTFRGNPSWAADKPCGPIHQEHLQTLSDFLTLAVARYSVPPYNVLHWSLYNEPDNGNSVDIPWLGGCWGANHPLSAEGAGGAAYANMMSYAYPAIKAGNQDAQVVLGGLAYEDWYLTDGGPFDYYFLYDFLHAGGAAYIDMVNFHYFPAWAWRWEDPDGDRYKGNIYGKTQNILTDVIQIGGEEKPIMCTEVGYPTAGPEGDVIIYNEELSSQYVMKVYARAMYTGIHPVIWLQAVDETWMEYDYGLMWSDLAKKQPYFSYETVVDELSGTQSVSARRDYPEDVEGYDFRIGDRTKTILWILGDHSANHSFPLESVGGVLRVVNRLGAERLIVDGSAEDLDSITDGHVVISIDADPRIVEDVSGGTPTPTPEHRFFLPVLLR